MEALVNELKKLWYVYHKTLEAVQYEVVKAYINGKFDRNTRDMLYRWGDRAVDVDRLTKRLLQDIERWVFLLSLVAFLFSLLG